MKNNRLHLGTAFGIGIYLHWTFFLLVLFVLISSSSFLSFFAGLTFVVLMFGSVVLHELGHALTARRFNIPTRDITLYPIGGVASLERMPRNPTQEMAIALAGPAVNVVLAAPLFLMAILFNSPLIMTLAIGNMVLALFNLLPAFPMDGGRVLRAALVRKKGYLGATETAAKVGRYCAAALAIFALVKMWPVLLIVSVFVFLAGTAELRQVQMQERFGRFNPWENEPATPPPVPPPRRSPSGFREIEFEVLPPREADRRRRYESEFTTGW